jgi:hypothetical protein
MAKQTTPQTREDLKDNIRKSLKEIPTTTRVLAWGFQVGKQNYVILKFVSMGINQIEIYESTRAGRRTGDKPIVALKPSKDHLLAFEQALEILTPQIEEETTEDTPVS